MNLGKNCGTCSSEENLQSLSTDGNEFVDMLTNLINIKILPDENYPSNICSVCVENLTIAFNFKKQCENTFAKFEEYLKYKEENVFDGVKENQENLFLIDVNDWKEEVVTIQEEIFINAEQLETETSTDKPKKKNQRSICKICNKSITKLYEHMRLHTNEKPYTCEYCSMEFSNSSNYKRHVRIHLNDRRFVCSICNRRFNVRYALVNHLSTHNNLKNQETVVQCELCERTFRGKNKLKLHVCELHCKEKNGSNQNDNNGDKKPTYLCNYCGKTCLKKANFEEHLRIHTGERPYKCQYCIKSFRNNLSLTTHETTHTGERPYQCDECDAKFKQSAHLRRHKWKHSGIKPYSCKLCNKRFTSSGSSTVHMRSAHTGEKPYQCSICDKRFFDSLSMKRHKKRHVVVVDMVNKSNDCIVSAVEPNS